MTDDIVARLREWDYCWPAPWLEHTVAAAADEIERLRGEVERRCARAAVMKSAR